MKLDSLLTARSLDEAITIARTAEDMGFDGAWSMENQHDPFLSLAVSATTTTRLTLGTAIAQAATPMDTCNGYPIWRASVSLERAMFRKNARKTLPRVTMPNLTPITTSCSNATTLMAST